MKRKIIFYNNKLNQEKINLFTKEKDIDFYFKMDPKTNFEICFETEKDIFMNIQKDNVFNEINEINGLNGINGIIKIDKFTNSISIDEENVKFFTMPRTNYFF